MGTKAAKPSNSTSSSTTTNTLSDFSQQQYGENKQGILDTINNYNTNSPFKSYTGDMVAGLGAGQEQAKAIAGANVGKAGGILDNAMAYDGSDVSKWYNPYEADVVNAAGASFDENLSRQLSQNQARATQNNAYGGSRHGVADAELMRTSGMDRANMVADLKYKGYNDARQAGSANQAAQFQGAQLSQQAWQQDANYMSQLGATDREIEQAKLLASRAEFDRQAADEYQRFMTDLQSRQGILGATPMITNSSSNGQSYGIAGTDPYNRTQGALAGAASGAAMGSAIPVWGTAAGAIAGGLYGAFGGG